jgi:hypothetical protein
LSLVPSTVAASAITVITTECDGASALAAGQSGDPHVHGIVVAPAASGLSASVRRWVVVRGSSGHTVAASSLSFASKAAASTPRTSPQISAIPFCPGRTSIWRSSSRCLATRTASESSSMTIQSTSSVILSRESLFHDGALRASCSSI